MKKVIILLVFFVGTICGATAQEKGKFYFDIDGQGYAGYGTDFRDYAFSFDVGYSFTNWFSAAVKLEDTYRFFKTDNIKTYENAPTLGGIVEFDFFKGKALTLSLRTAAGGTVGNNIWK
jgi:hypothetical protein